MLPLPLFRFGAEDSSLGWISGPLLFDSGEADRSFLYRCQDRYFSYNQLSAIRSLVMVKDWDHVLRYQTLFRRQRMQLEVLSRETGLILPECGDPLYVPLGWETGKVDRQDWFHGQNMPARFGLVLNQVSPTAATLIGGLNSLFPEDGRMDERELDRLERQGRLALRFHDKAEYVELCQGLPEIGPHARTVILNRSELLRLQNWSDIASRFSGSAPEEVFLKSSFDSGGNFSAPLSPATCQSGLQAMKDRAREEMEAESASESAVSGLAADLDLSLTLGHRERGPGIADLVREQQRKRGSVRFLLQERVREPASGMGPGRAGICCDANEGPLFASAQIYRDAERKHFLGAYMNREFSNSVFGQGMRELRALCAVFAREGYSGPIGFDACAGPGKGAWTLIYDCNPRLSAVYPALVVWRLLESQGLDCRDLISLGYRGEWNEKPFEEALQKLASESLLFGAGRNRGILLLPNMSRANGCDVLLVNIAVEEAADFVKRAGLGEREFQLAW